jgi:hypothetical protein
MQCRNNLMNLSLALQNYHGAHRTLPPGTVDFSGPIVSGQNQGYRMSWIAQILPYIDEANVYSKIDFDVPAYDPANTKVSQHSIQTLICPSSTARGPTYAGVHHDVEAPIDSNNNGVLFLNSLIRLPEDVPDGLGYTLFLGEKEGTSATWLVGDNSTLRNTGSPPGDAMTAGLASSTTPGGQVMGTESPDDATPLPPVLNLVGAFNSSHASGSNFALGDGNVRFISANIDLDLYRRLAHRNDGSLIGSF